MTLTINHKKTDNIASWTQAELDAQIALGNFPAGTHLADIVLPSDWNDTHNFSGVLPVANGGTGTANGLPTIASGYVFNPSANILPKFRAAIAKVLASGGNAHILWVGTSTVDGFNTGGNGAWSQQYTLEQQMATMLSNAYGIPAQNDSIFGFTAGAGRDTNPNLTVGAGWGADTVASIGGSMFTNNSDTTTLVFALPATADRVKIYYPTDNSGAPTLGTFSYKINSGVVTNVNQGTAAPAVATATINVTAGAGNTLTITRVSGTCKFIGIEPYLSTKSTINIINSGWGGITAGTWNDSSGKAYATNAAWNEVSPDLTIIQMDNNDAISGTALATYKTNITSVITGSNNGDALLISQVPYGAAGGDITALPAYITAQQQIATASSIPFIDQTLRITSYDGVFTPNGLSNQDGLHANTGGYIDQAQFITNQLMVLSGTAPLSEQFPHQFINGNLGGGIYGLFSGTTQIAWGNSTSWIFGHNAGTSVPQGVLKTDGANYTNGTAQGGVISKDSTTGGAAGVGGGFIAQYDDGNGVPRAGAGFFTRKYDSTVGNVGGDAIITSRANAATNSDMLKLSATDNLITAYSPVSSTQFKSTVSTGTAPFTVLSTTQVANLNAATAGSATTATTATNATNVATTQVSANTSYYPLFVSSSTNGNQAADLGTGLTFNPSTNNLTTTTFTGALSGNSTTATTATNATNTGITEDTSTNATMYPTWVTANTGNLPQKTTSTKLTFNPSTGVLSSTSFTGAGTGLTGTGASFTAGNVTTNANLTGPITSSGNATSIGSQTGTGSTFVMSASPSITGTLAAAIITASSTFTGTSASANALAVGANGATNPAFNVDASTASSTTGINIKSAASGGGVTLSAISGQSTEALTISTKGDANLTLKVGGTNSTFAVQLNAVTRFAVINGQAAFTPQTASAAATAKFLYTGAADTAMTVSTEAPSIYFNMGQTRQHAQGALTLQRDFRITGSTHSFATGAATATDVAALSIDGFGQAGTNATITNAHGILIPAQAVAGTVTNAYGINVVAPTGAGTLNQAALFTGDVGLTSGNLLVNTIGKGLSVKSGTNARIGTGTLVGGTLVVNNTSVTANTRVFLQDTGTSVVNVGSLTVTTVANTSFTVTSTNALDVSTFNWLLVESA